LKKSAPPAPVSKIFFGGMRGRHGLAGPDRDRDPASRDSSSSPIIRWKSLVEHFGAGGKLAPPLSAGGRCCAVGLMIKRGRHSPRSYARILIAGGVASIYYTTYAACCVPLVEGDRKPSVLGRACCLLLPIAGRHRLDGRPAKLPSPAAGLAIVLAFYASAVNPLAYFTLASNAILALAAVALMCRRRWMAVPFLALAAAYWSYLYWRLAENWRFWEVHVPGGCGPRHTASVSCPFTGSFSRRERFSRPARKRLVRRGRFFQRRPSMMPHSFASAGGRSFPCSVSDCLWIASLIFGAVQFGLFSAARGAVLVKTWACRSPPPRLPRPSSSSPSRS